MSFALAASRSAWSAVLYSVEPCAIQSGFASRLTELTAASRTASAASAVPAGLKKARAFVQPTSPRVGGASLRRNALNSVHSCAIKHQDHASRLITMQHAPNGQCEKLSVEEQEYADMTIVTAIRHLSVAVRLEEDAHSGRAKHEAIWELFHQPHQRCTERFGIGARPPQPEMNDAGVGSWPWHGRSDLNTGKASK
eukprot:SAG11_NODE_58_length_19205_cov_30.697315_10_plen_196_part_00